MADGRESRLTRRQLAAERAAVRRAAASRRRNRQYWVVGGIAMALVLVAVLAGAALLGGDGDEDQAAVATWTVDPNDPVAPILSRYAAGECPPSDDAQASECDLGEAVPDLGRDHIEEGAEHEPYNSTPPTSGPHYGSTAPWGVSEAPIPDEVQVHNLEHGGVMLQYNCDCPEAIALLERPADPATGYPTKLIAAPYPGMESEIALTAWGRIWTMPAAELTADRVRAFVDGYVDRGPERIPSESQRLEAWRESDAPKP